MVTLDFLFHFLVCDIHAYMHFSCVWADAYVWYEHMCACIKACGGLRLVVGRVLYQSSTLFTETLLLSQNNRLSI